MTQVINKELIGIEDLCTGPGSEMQDRGGNPVVITKINLDWLFSSAAQLTARDVTKIQHAVVLDGSNNRLAYDYLASSTAIVDGINVLQPDVGAGRWILSNGIKTRLKGTFADSDATPDVSTSEFWRTSPTTPITITDIDGGVDGQLIYIVGTNGNTTFQHAEAASGINLKGKVDKVLAIYEGITLIRNNNNWWTEV